jgi:hypothetical protein
MIEISRFISATTLIASMGIRFAAQTEAAVNLSHTNKGMVKLTDDPEST